MTWLCISLCVFHCWWMWLMHPNFDICVSRISKDVSVQYLYTSFLFYSCEPTDAYHLDIFLRNNDASSRNYSNYLIYKKNHTSHRHMHAHIHKHMSLHGQKCNALTSVFVTCLLTAFHSSGQWTAAKPATKSVISNCCCHSRARFMRIWLDYLLPDWRPIWKTGKLLIDYDTD